MKCVSMLSQVQTFSPGKSAINETRMKAKINHIPHKGGL